MDWVNILAEDHLIEGPKIIKSQIEYKHFLMTDILKTKGHKLRWNVLPDGLVKADPHKV